MYISKGAKKAYLSSPEWKAKRKLVLKRDNYTCQGCGSIGALECHHIRYDNLTQEPLEDLVMLCRKCHGAIHDKLGYDRSSSFPVS